MHTSGLIFRTAGPWGAGKGSNLTPAEVDGNFFDLDERLDDVETNPPTPIEISSISVVGASMTVSMADGSSFGPFALPIADLNYRGDWQPLTDYLVSDIFRVAGLGAYIVTVNFTSATLFDPDGVEYDLMVRDGANWFSGSGPPAASLGDEGDLYLDTANGDLYQHGGTGGWAVIDNLHSIGTLDTASDVDYPTGGPADGDALIWRASTGGGAWGPEAQSGKTATVQTTDATQTVLASGAMVADSAHTVRAYGHGREDATGDALHFEIFGGARNEAGTSSAPAPNIIKVNDAGAATWDVTLVANDTSDEWEIKVTGEAAHTIDWTLTYFEIITQQ